MSENEAVARVAIIMRTMNRDFFLDRAIRDVLAQTFGDWFLVIVNDGGDAPSVDRIVARYAEQLSDSVLVLHNTESRGMEAASNLGIRSSESTFITIHDDDDEWRPDFLATTVDYLDSHDDEGVMVRTEVVYERLTCEGTEVLTREVLGRQILEPDMRRITLPALIHHNRGVPISFLYRRRTHDTIGVYDETLDVIGDWEFHVRFVRSFSIGFIDGEPRAFWNQRPGLGGELGNSVVDRAKEHRVFDEVVRENYLKKDIEEHGLGMLMFGSMMHREVMDQLRRQADQLDQQRDRLAHLEAAISDASLVSLLRRRYRRLKDRLGARSTGLAEEGEP